MKEFSRVKLGRDSMERKPKAAPLKKSYEIPKLQIYGSLAEMTKGGAPSTMSDMGNNHMS